MAVDVTATASIDRPRDQVAARLAGGQARPAVIASSAETVNR